MNPINTMWTVIAAFLVFFMQAGFMMLEAGFSRTRETVNVLLEGIVDTCLCGILFWAWGFAFMFGAGNGFIGHQYFFLQGVPETYGSTGVAFLAYWLFQFAFADTCSTITSGAMVGRTGFVEDLLYSFGVSGFIYPIIGHWAWGPDGWLTTITPVPFHDFARIHGGAYHRRLHRAWPAPSALGPRLGRKFKRDGGGPMPGHDMTIAAVGGVILWFGWYGFNPGSTLSAMDASGCGRVAANTTLAACGGGLSALAFIYPRSKVWDCGATVNGFLAGLVAIPCPCYWVSPTGAIILGAVAGVVCIVGVDFVEWLRVDDPVGAVAVHGFCGIWGTLSLGLPRVRQIRRFRAHRCGQLRRLGPHGPLLRRRHQGRWSPRPSAAHPSPSRPSVSRMAFYVCRQAHGHAARLRGGRARRTRSPRARWLGVSRASWGAASVPCRRRPRRLAPRLPLPPSEAKRSAQVGYGRARLPDAIARSSAGVRSIPDARRQSF